jgi:hypothetical protein
MDINIESQIVVQTAAQWAADSTVYSEQRLLITSDVFYGATYQRKFKIADGVQTWSNLNYFPVSGYDDATSSIQTQLDGKKGVIINLFTPSAANLADALTYYFGANGQSTFNTNELSGSAPAPVSCTIKSIYGLVSYGAGSSENVVFSLSINGSSFTTIATVALDSGTFSTAFNLTGQSISVTAGDRLSIRMVCPTWVTNPTSFRGSFLIYAE